MFWEFPLKIQTLETSTEEKGHRTFETEEEFIKFLWEQFKLPGKYELKNSIRFKDAGMQYTRTVNRPNFEGGYYVNAIKGTHRWKQYWLNEKERVMNGYIVDGFYIPPFYYWYLNFCPIINDTKKKDQLQLPDVWDSDLWYMHYVMLCLMLGKHVGGIKGRQKGYSFKHMAIIYWSYCWFGKSINTIGAFDEKLVEKSWLYLEGYRKHINSTTAWKRGPKQAKSLKWIEYTLDENEIPRGNGAVLTGITFKQSPFTDVGSPKTFFNYEEPGTSPTILETFEAMRPTMEKGGIVVGTIIACGSVGDLEDAKGIKALFYHPTDYNFLPIKNIWDTKNPTDECCIFISEAYNMIGYDKEGLIEQGRSFMDKDGNSDVEFSMQWIAKKQEIEKKSSKAHHLKQIALSQKCISPEQAFDQRKSAEFPIEQLRMQQERILLKDRDDLWAFKPFKCLLTEDINGNIRFITDNLPPEHRYPIVPTWEDKRGVVTFYVEPPKQTPKWSIYFAGLDTVEADFTSTSDSVVSLDIYQRMVKYKYQDKDGQWRTKYEGGKIVATYRGRFDPAEKTNEQCWLLIKIFNAFCFHDRSKPGFLNYMKRNGRAEKYLAKETDVPLFKDMNHISIFSKSNYGWVKSANNQTLTVFKSNLKEYLGQEFDRIENENGEVIKIINGIDRIDDYWTLEEYCRYNEKENFDRFDSTAAAITIGKTYENEFGIPTIIQMDEQPKITRKEKQPINLLGGGSPLPVNSRRPTTNKGPNKPYSFI